MVGSLFSQFYSGRIQGQKSFHQPFFFHTKCWGITSCKVWLTNSTPQNLNSAHFFVQKLSEEEMATIDKICKEEANSFILFDREIIKGLHRRGLVYFDVPVYPDDRFQGIFAAFSLIR